jgi:hypothetical protein
MSRFSYTAPLQSSFVSSVSIDAMFSDLKTFLNVPSLSAENFRQMAVRYRHLSMVPIIDLFAETKGYTCAVGGAFAGYYPVGATILKFKVQHTGLDNIYETNRNVYQCRAKLHMSDGTVSSLTTRACIGYSIDLGVNWVPMPAETGRPTRVTNGEAQQFFNGLQTDPYLGLPNWDPPNANRDRHVILEAAFGGEALYASAGSLSGGVNAVWVCVMLNSNTIGNGWFHIQHAASCRLKETT